jgi:hypothetical protein
MLRTAAVCLLASGLAGLATSAATAEIYLLKSGGRIEAQPLNPDRAPAEPYLVRTALGVRMALAPAQVRRVVVKSDVQKQYEAALPQVPNTADGHWQMAEWCKEAGLLDERKTHLNQVIDLEPDHEPARTALGYSRIAGSWMTQEEYFTSRGYIRSGGVWKLPQQIELEAAARERELAEKELRRNILMWLDQLEGRRREDALRSLTSIRDPRAVMGLVEVLSDRKRSREVRLLCLEILTKLPAGLAGGALVRLAMDDNDAEVRDKCLDELIRAGGGAAEFFIGQLTSKDNKRVNRAALCLERLADRDATLPLIAALVTTHEYWEVPAGGGSGGINFNSSGGLSMGGSPKRKRVELKNDTVLAALTSLNPGVNFNYDEEAWRRWYTEKFTTTQVDLRRDE